MSRKKYVAFLTVILFAFVFGTYLGAWSERKNWRDAREYVEKDLVVRGLDPQHLGVTEVVETPGQELRYGFTYMHKDIHLDYVVSFAGPRGLELHTWDYARDEKR